MGLPKTNAPPEQHHAAGIHTETMLELEDRTADLAPVMAPHTQKINDFLVQEKELDIRQIKAYARVVWADGKLEDTVRDLSGDAKKADRSDPNLKAHASLFPEGGFGSLIQPSGRLVSKQIDDIRGRYPILRALTQKAPELASYEDRLEAGCQVAEKALKTLAEVDKALSELGVQMRLVLEQWRTAAYQIEGELLKRFPGRKDLVRSYFVSSPHSPKKSAPPPAPPAPPSPT